MFDRSYKSTEPVRCHRPPFSRVPLLFWIFDHSKAVVLHFWKEIFSQTCQTSLVKNNCRKIKWRSFKKGKGGSCVFKHVSVWSNILTVSRVQWNCCYSESNWQRCFFNVNLFRFPVAAISDKSTLKHWCGSEDSLQLYFYNTLND